MASDELIRSVSRKLKYYFQIKRLEDSFDLSGPHVPVLDHPPLRNGSLVHYPAVYDRSLKHYFSHPEARIQLTKFKSPMQQGESLDKMQQLLTRERKIRKIVERQLKKTNFKDPPVPYEAFMNTKNGPRLRPELRGVRGPYTTGTKRVRGFSGAYPQLRMVPNSDISKLEGDRLVQNATKLLLTMETVDLSSRKHTTTATGSKLQYLPRERARSAQPARRKKRTAGSASGASSERASSVKSGARSTDGDDARGPMPPWLSKEIARRLAEEDAAGADQSACVRTYSAPTPPKGERPGSAVGSRRRPFRRTVGDGSENISTQTERSSPQADQSLQPVPEEDHVTYRVRVTTGMQIGASTNAEVSLTLYGSLGRSPEVELTNSKTNRLPFRKGQTDEFEVSLPYVGALKRVQIGHNSDASGSDWFLETVTVHDPRTNQNHLLRCSRWLSAREIDGLTKRVLHVTEETAPTPAPVMSSEASRAGSSSSSRAGEKEAEEEENQAAEEEEEDEERSESGSELTASTATVRSDQRESDTEGESETESYETETESEAEEEEEEEAVVASDTEVSRVAPSEKEAEEEEEEEDEDEEEEEEEEEEAEKSSGSSVVIETTPTSQRSVAEEEKEEEEEEEEEEEVVRVEDDEEGASIDLQERRAASEKTIHLAVEDGDLSRVTDLISANPDLVNTPDERGFSPLHIACERGHVDMLEWLCGNGASLQAETTTGYQAMHLAALEHNLKCMMALNALGADLNAPTTDGQTPLHIAAKNGHLEAVKWLVSSGAEVDRRDNGGQRAVSWAQQYGHHTVVQFLHGLATSSMAAAAEEEELPPYLPPPTQVVPARLSRRMTEEKLLQEKKDNYEKQRQSLDGSEVSFLDLIRNEASLT